MNFWTCSLLLPQKEQRSSSEPRPPRLSYPPLAMAFAIAATRASGPVTIASASSVDVSYPGFFETLGHLAR